MSSTDQTGDRKMKTRIVDWIVKRIAGLIIAVQKEVHRLELEEEKLDRKWMESWRRRRAERETQGDQKVSRNGDTPALPL